MKIVATNEKLCKRDHWVGKEGENFGISEKYGKSFFYILIKYLVGWVISDTFNYYSS